MPPSSQLMETLRKAGLTSYESEAYFALLSRRELTAEEISEMTSVPITRVYGTLEQLMQKGFARIVQSRPKRFHAIPPDQARRDYLAHMRENFETNLVSVEEIMRQLQREVEPLYVESHLQVRAEELLEPLNDLRVMEKKTGEYVQKATEEVLISTALFSWLPKVKTQLRTAISNGAKARILMQAGEGQMKKHLRDLADVGAQIRDTRDPWHPVRGTLVDNRDLIFVIWAAEETEKHWNPIVYTPHHTKNPGLIRIFRESFDFRWSNAKRTNAGVGLQMKVWLDVLTPKQANFLAEFQRRLSAKGHKTVLTTREYREVNELLELRGIKAIQIGRHGGGALNDKLLESSKRVVALAKEIEEQKPDVSISFSSPEAARVAFGLKIPHYSINDSPHAEAVCRLTIPLSQKLFTPWVVPLYAWKRYGIAPRDIVRYRALDPITWLSGYKAIPKALDELKLDRAKPIVILRTPEEFAAYLSDHSSSAFSKSTDVIRKVIDLNGEVQLVVLPRYNNQAEQLRKSFGGRVIVPDHVIDAVALMQVSSVFVGGGGTMTAEAALLGLPVISYYPGDPTFVERFLISYGLVERILDSSRVAQRVIGISNSEDFREFYRKRSARLVRSMEDPLKVIMQRIFKR